MQTVQHIAASKTVARAFVDSALKPKAFGVERAPVGSHRDRATLKTTRKDQFLATKSYCRQHIRSRLLPGSVYNPMFNILSTRPALTLGTLSYWELVRLCL